MFVPVHVPQPSRRARDLGHKMAELIRIFKQEAPGLSLMEVRQAMRVAESDLRADFPGLASVGAVIAIMLAALFAGILVFFILADSNGWARGEGLPVIILVTVGVMTLGLLALVLSKRLRQ